MHIGARLSLFWLHKAILNPDTRGPSYRESGMTIGTCCTGMKGLEAQAAHSPSHIKTQTCTRGGSLMPVFFCQRCREERSGRRGNESKGREEGQAEDESRSRATPIRNDSRRRSRQRRVSVEKTGRILTGEMEEHYTGW